MESDKKVLNNCTELFIIYLRNNVIAYSTFDLINEMHINSLCFISVIKIIFSEKWLSVFLQAS